MSIQTRIPKVIFDLFLVFEIKKFSKRTKHQEIQEDSYHIIVFEFSTSQILVRNSAKEITPSEMIDNHQIIIVKFPISKILVRNFVKEISPKRDEI